MRKSRNRRDGLENVNHEQADLDKDRRCSDCVRRCTSPDGGGWRKLAGLLMKEVEKMEGGGWLEMQDPRVSRETDLMRAQWMGGPTNTNQESGRSRWECKESEGVL